MVTTLDVMSGLLSVTTTSSTQLERPEEVIRLLKVGANSEYLMDQVLDANDTILSKSLQ